ncbi:MAG: hypothetical protein IPM92_12540 [Saprospiraceae bacterium]|nr:hypothetical protein [Saprospiraceae bacterium]
MKEILKFLLLFLGVYAIVIFLQSFHPVQSAIQYSFRSSIELFLKASFPKAYIETQNYQDAAGNFDSNIFYLRYGNPEVIQAEHDFARKNQMKEYKISSHSIQLYIFQLFTVPLAFLIALFVASPMLWKPKLKYLLLSLTIMSLIILLKVNLLTLYNMNISKIGVYTLATEDLTWVFRLISMLTLGFSIMICFILWLLFGFRNSRFALIVNSFLKSLQT